MTTLKKGMQGEEIKAVQILLQKRGFSVGAKGIDGKYGTDTETAVRAFQAKMGLWVDGKVGGETYSALVTGKIKAGSRLRDGSYAGQTSTKTQTIKPMQQPTSHGGTSTLAMPEADEDGSMWLWGGLGVLAAWYWWKRRKRKRRRNLFFLFF